MNQSFYGIMYRSPDSYYLGIYKDGKIESFSPIDFDAEEKEISLVEFSAVVVELLDSAGERFNINELFTVQSEIFDAETHEQIKKNIYELAEELLIDMTTSFYSYILKQTYKDN